MFFISDRRARAAVLAGLASLVLSACQTGPTARQFDILNQALDEALFGQSADMAAVKWAAKGAFLARWEGPLAYRIKGGPTRAQQDAIEGALKRVAAASGIALRALEPGAEPADGEGHLEIEIANDDEFVINRNRRAACYASTKQTDGTGALERAKVVVPRGRFPQDHDCIDHELMHAFGFRGHSHRVRSVLSSAHREDRLTVYDVHFLKTLYDPALESGLPRVRALAEARRVLSRRLNVELSHAH